MSRLLDLQNSPSVRWCTRFRGRRAHARPQQRAASHASTRARRTRAARENGPAEHHRVKMGLIGDICTLPNGWYSAKDAGGQTYYYNRAKRVTQYERPCSKRRAQNVAAYTPAPVYPVNGYMAPSWPPPQSAPLPGPPYGLPPPAVPPPASPWGAPPPGPPPCMLLGPPPGPPPSMLLGPPPRPPPGMLLGPPLPGPPAGPPPGACGLLWDRLPRVRLRGCCSRRVDHLHSLVCSTRRLHRRP